MSTATKKRTTAKASKITTKKATAKKTIAKRTTAEKTAYIPTENEIRERAFRIFVERGYQSGNELENWLTAEAELRKN